MVPFPPLLLAEPFLAQVVDVSTQQVVRKIPSEHQLDGMDATGDIVAAGSVQKLFLFDVRADVATASTVPIACSEHYPIASVQLHEPTNSVFFICDGHAPTDGLNVLDVRKVQDPPTPDKISPGGGLYRILHPMSSGTAVKLKERKGTPRSRRRCSIAHCACR